MTCNNCGWVHFGVDRAHIDAWKTKWAEYWPTLDQDGRDAFGLPDGPPTDELYYQCSRCGGPYTNFRESKEDDCPIGCTISPILNYLTETS